MYLINMGLSRFSGKKSTIDCFIKLLQYQPKPINCSEIVYADDTELFVQLPSKTGPNTEPCGDTT